MDKKTITLFDILKLVFDRHWPGSIDEDDKVFISSPDEDDRVIICFTDDERTWLYCDAQNAILIPWYGCEVYGLEVATGGQLMIWVKFEDFLKDDKYSDYLWRTKK